MDHVKIYANFLRRFLRVRESIKVIFDSSNGTTGMVLKELLRSNRFIKPVFSNARPDGNFPAHGPNPWGGSAIADLGRRVLKTNSDFGVIFDGDGDRVFFVDNRGRSISGDMTALLLGQSFRGPVILDVRAGYIAREYFSGAGRKVIESRVGHFFIKRRMREEKIQFGAEASGHYYFAVKDSGNMLYFDSGILAAVHFMNQAARIMKQGMKLSDWIDALPKTYRIPETNFKVRDKRGIMKKTETHFKKSAKRISKMDGIRMDFRDYWFSIRPSNTEDLLRLNLEAKSAVVLRAELGKLKALIRS